MKKAFSLIEVLVFTSILSVFFVGAMSVVTYSLRMMKANQHKILASHYAKEAIEWLRGQKEDSWSVFAVRDSAAGPSTYCVSTLSFAASGTCATYALGTPTIFKREVILENEPDSVTPLRVNATVNVTWLEGVGTRSLTSKTVFTILE